MHSFEYFCPTKVHFGLGTRNKILEVLSKSEWENIALVVDHNLVKQDIVATLLKEIESSVKECVLAECDISEPTYDSLDSIRKEFMGKSLQVVIGVGGGSALDMAKAVAVLVHNERPAIHYRGFDMMTEPVLPIIAIPSTAGTGSEVTPNASFIDSKAKKKMGINGEAVRPVYAFLDPEMTISCPKEVTISAGADSMVHAIEAFSAKKTNSLARFFAKEGFQKAFSVLPQLINDLGNIDLRQEIMYGAFLSGVALMHSGTGPAAAMSYPLSVHFKVPHGIGGGIFLPKIVEHNINQGYTEYHALMDSNISASNISSSEFLSALNSTWMQLGIPEDLSSFSIKAADIDLLAKETMELEGALDQNPIPFHQDEIKAALTSLIHL